MKSIILLFKVDNEFKRVHSHTGSFFFFSQNIVFSVYNSKITNLALMQLIEINKNKQRDKLFGSRRVFVRDGFCSRRLAKNKNNGADEKLGNDEHKQKK